MSSERTTLDAFLITYMRNFGASVLITVPAEEVFDFASKPENMPQYLSTVTRAERQGEDRIKIFGNVDGREYASDGWYDVDEHHLMMRWGSDGENRYVGHLTVTPMDAFTCKAEVHLIYEPRPDQAEQFQSQMGNRLGVIQQGLDRAMQSMKQICEGNTHKIPADLQIGRRGKGYVS